MSLFSTRHCVAQSGEGCCSHWSPVADGRLPTHAAVGHCHPASQTHLPVPQFPVPSKGCVLDIPQPVGSLESLNPWWLDRGPLQDWPAKVSYAAKRLPGGPSGSCLPRPGPPRVRSKPPRPWPGARTSSPAQMPPGSRRVGTCLWPRAGDWDQGCTTTSPLPAWLSAFLC